MGLGGPSREPGNTRKRKLWHRSMVFRLAGKLVGTVQTQIDGCVVDGGDALQPVG